MSETVTHRDIAGRQIVPGDFVVYAALWRRSATLKFGRVTRLVERDDTYSHSTGIVETQRHGTLRLVTVDRHWDGCWKLQKDGREVTLSKLDQVMVVPLASVPPEALSLLLIDEEFIPYG